MNYYYYYFKPSVHIILREVKKLKSKYKIGYNHQSVQSSQQTVMQKDSIEELQQNQNPLVQEAIIIIIIFYTPGSKDPKG